MGGMIAQTFALDYPERTRTLVSIMSTTGDPTVGPAPARGAGDTGGAAGPRPRGSHDRASTWMAVSVRPGSHSTRRLCASVPPPPTTGPPIPAGMARQLAAIVTQPDRTAALASVTVPTLVIHGEADPLVIRRGAGHERAAFPGRALARARHGSRHAARVERPVDRRVHRPLRSGLIEPR